MQLIIFPGGGSPHSVLYSKVYSLLETEAAKFGYAGVDCSISWPGQALEGAPATAPLTLQGAEKVAAAKIAEYENQGIPYDLVGRSFGALIAAKCATALKPRLLRKVVFWGPSAFWLLWQKFVRDLATNQQEASANGLTLDESYFPSLEPFESLVQRVEYPMTIATGSEDIYSSPGYLAYLGSILAHKKNVRLTLVQGAPHEVTRDLPQEVVGAYLRALFE